MINEPKLRAGAATSNITPPLGVSLNGGMRNRMASHIHDELHARCLVLDDGATRIGLAVCDSCMIPAHIFESAKHMVHEHTELPIDRMLMSATHTHTAPTVAGVFQSEPSAEYAEFLALRIADGLRRAINQLEPAKIAWCAADEPSQVFNRRWRMKPSTILEDPFGRQRDQVKMNPPRASDQLLDPAGPIDPQVAVLSVRSTDGRPIAVLANYSLHYVGGAGAGHVSADYFAMFADRIVTLCGARDVDPPMVGIMTNGTSGNINNVNFRLAAESQPRYAQMRKVAAVVAAAAFRALDTARYHDHVRLDMRESPITLGRRLPEKSEVERARFILSQARGESLTSLEQIYARETVLMSDWPPTIDTVLEAVRIGDLGIAAIPCEVFVETGLAIKEQSPFEQTFTIELANDYCGYLPTAEHHNLGGYETWRARSSFLAEDAEEKIRTRLLTLLGEMS